MEEDNLLYGNNPAPYLLVGCRMAQSVNDLAGATFSGKYLPANLFYACPTDTQRIPFIDKLCKYLDLLNTLE